MKSKIFLFDKSIMQSDLKRFWWVSALYAVLLFFILPLQHMLQELPLEEGWQKTALLNSLHLSPTRTAPYYSLAGINLQALLLCTVPVFLAVMLFSYLHSARAATMFHSLPLKRGTLLGSHTAAGLLLVFIPVVAIGAVMAVLALFTGLGDYYSLLNVLEWIGLTLLFNTLFFSIAVFVGMFTGSAIAHILFTYILNVLPYGIYILVVYNIENLLHGFSPEAISDGWARWLPFIKVVGYDFFDFSPAKGLLYLLAAFVFLAASGFAYHRRPVESAGNIIAFRAVQPVFRYGFAVCLTLLGGFITGYFYHSGKAAVILACILFAFFGYWSSQMLLEKTMKVWRAYRGYLVFTAITVLLLAGLSADVTGYAKYIPKSGEIESAYFGYNYTAWLYEKNKVPVSSYFRTEGFFKEEANRKAVMSLHRMLAENGDSGKGREGYVAYILKNGKSVIRKYKIDEPAVRQFLVPLYESQEFKEDRYPVLSQKAQDIKVIEVSDDRASKKPLILSDPKQLQDFIAILWKELRNADYEEVAGADDEYVYIRITDRDDHSHSYRVRKSFDAIYSWLKENNYYESVMLLPREVDHVVVKVLKVEWYDGGGYGSMETGKSMEFHGEDRIRKLIDVCTPSLRDTAEETCFSLSFYSRANEVRPLFSGYILSSASLDAKLKQELEELAGDAPDR